MWICIKAPTKVCQFRAWKGHRGFLGGRAGGKKQGWRRMPGLFANAPRSDVSMFLFTVNLPFFVKKKEKETELGSYSKPPYTAASGHGCTARFDRLIQKIPPEGQRDLWNRFRTSHKDLISHKLPTLNLRLLLMIQHTLEAVLTQFQHCLHRS